jgi:hypothetical protein
MNAVREQADLTKADPFVIRGVTPRSMFYGRQDEEATVSALLSDSSAALLGGRMTGKTSLLQHIMRKTSGDGLLIHYADLQSVGNWRTLAAVISQRWDIEAPAEFAPSHMAEIVRKLKAGDDDARLVIMFDEVDRLLRWDQHHDDEHVPEAFFRACRALSQEGTAQFVFSGERTIAQRLWAPDSPHWNFCRTVPVRQLARKDADRLLAVPLEHLEVTLVDREQFLDHAWARTSGHAQIVQHLGSQLILLLNEREPDERGRLSVADLEQVTGRADFRQHYVRTYMGQATPFERTVCILAARGANTRARLSEELRLRNESSDTVAVEGALRMLDLYGILDITDDLLEFRATWMPEALRLNDAA